MDRELADGPYAVPSLHRRNLRPGRYYEHTKRLLEHFPRSSLLVLLMEDLTSDPAKLYRQLCDHIGVNSTALPENLGATFNRISPVRSKLVRRTTLKLDLPRRLPRDVYLRFDRLNRRVGERYPPLDLETRQVLLDYYAADTDALEEWLGRDLSAWRR